MFLFMTGIRMPTLQHIFNSITKESPYSGAIFAEVCGKGEKVHYKNASGQQRQSLTIGLADHTKAVKAILYDTSVEETFEVGSAVMLLNVIIKKDQNAIIITTRSKARKSSLGQTVPEVIRLEAKGIACPPAAPEIAVKDVQSSPVKTLVSVKGQVISVELERTVKVNGEDAIVKSIKIKDGTASCKVSLWRDMAKEKNEVGTYVQITNVIVQAYNDEKMLSTTSKTKMQKVDVPQETKTIKVVAFQTPQNNTIALTDENSDYDEVVVSLGALCNALICEETDVVTELESKLPLTLKVIMKGPEVIQIDVED